MTIFLYALWPAEGHLKQVCISGHVTWPSQGHLWRWMDPFLVPLLTFPSSVFAELVNLHFGLFETPSLWSFRVMNALDSAMHSIFHLYLVSW